MFHERIADFAHIGNDHVKKPFRQPRFLEYSRNKSAAGDGSVVVRLENHAVALCRRRRLPEGAEGDLRLRAKRRLQPRAARDRETALRDVKLSTISRAVIEGFQAKRRLEGAGNRTINMDVGALRQVLKRFKQWRRLEDDVKMLTETGGAPVGRALTPEEQKRLFEAAASNPEWEHVYCAAVLAANTSMRGVEVKHVRRRDVDLEKVWDVESVTGKGVLRVTKSKNQTSKRVLPLNNAARTAVERMLKRADDLGHTDPNHYLWCSTQHHKLDPTKPASKWDTAWHALRDAAGLPGFRFHDLRHTVVTDLLEAGEPEHVIEAVTGHLSRRMLEHYSHQRLKAKGRMLARLEERRKKESA
jgi:integrase